MARSPVSPPQRPLVPDSPIGRIDRRALVSRHDPVLHRYDPENPLTVGNGEFAFTADVTGLQTFPQPLGGNSKCIPLCTQSQWGWHSTPNPENWSVEGYLAAHPEVKGYADYPNAAPSSSPDVDAPGTPEIEWLKENPHRLDLGRLALHWIKADGSAASPSDLTDVEQRLSLWDGELISRFQLQGEPVEVRTLVHPKQDAVAVRVVSPLLQQGRLGLSLAFPSGNPARFSDAAAWDHPEAHETLLVQPREGRAFFERNLDADYYYASARWSPGARLRETAQHHFLLTPEGRSAELEWVCLFSQHPTPGDLPNFEETRAAARSHWNRFWSTGGAVDLSASRDPRWRELERRIVLSQYLTAIQCAGSLPPQESGLTGNSWSGKFHLEMHWWHATHFALWDRAALLEKSLGYYRSILPWAREIAQGQGYTGARWPKTPGPRGGEFPSHIAPYLLWQQPHPIYYAELCYRANPGKATLEKYREIVFETAEFMASFCKWDDGGRRFVLGPPMQCAQELYPRFETFNSLFELTYWRWGLQTARRWRERLGLDPEPKWDGVLAGLSRPVVSEGKYLFTENISECYTNSRWTRDHPSVLGALGMLPGPGIDPAVMRRTFDWIWSQWTWEHTWGWDYPLAAMTAARLGAPEKAIDALLMATPKNRYALNGHVFQFGKLPLYLPANGGLLSAVAMMAAGWDGGPERPAPGFPDNGQWAVRWENLRPLP